MAQWEYCRLIWSIRKLDQHDQQALGDYEILKDESAEMGSLLVATFGTLRFLGSGRDRQRISNADETIAQLGREGWELVSHTLTEGNPSTDIYYFKRPLSK